MNNFILVIIGLLFSSYGIICGIECGSGLALYRPRLSSNSKLKFNHDSLWMAINVLVLLLIVVSIILAKESYLSVNQSVTDLLAIGAVALLFKLTIANGTFKKKTHFYTSRYYIVSYLSALSLGAVGIYAVTGKNFWLTFVGWTLMVATILGLSVIGLSYANREKAYLKRTKLRQYIDIMFCAWVVALGFFYPVGLEHYNSSLITTPLSIMNVVIVIGVLGYAVTAIKQKKPNELYQYATLIGFIVPLLITLNDQPYLISLKINLSAAFSLSSYHHSINWLAYVFVALAIVIILLSIYAIGRLLNIWELLKLRNLRNKKAVV